MDLTPPPPFTHTHSLSGKNWVNVHTYPKIAREPVHFGQLVAA